MQEHVSRDNVNYFYGVGKTYTDNNVIQSKSKQFCRLFRGHKNQFIIKIGNPKTVKNFTDIDISLYEKGCLLFLEFRFSSDVILGNFNCTFPIDCVAMKYDRIKLPEFDEAMDFEFHFVDVINDKLLKVVRFNASNLEFSNTLANEYMHRVNSGYSQEQASRTLDSVLLNASTMGLLVSSKSFIVKQDPVNDEPMNSNEYLSILDTMRLNA